MGKSRSKKQIFNKFLLPAQRFKFHSDTSQYVNVGKTGGPNVYDFSSLTFPDSVTYTLYSSSQIPQLAARFNPSSLVWGTSPQNISDSPVFFITDSSLTQLGRLLFIRIRRNTGMILRMRKFSGSRQHIIFNGAQARAGRELIRRMSTMLRRA